MIWLVMWCVCHVCCWHLTSIVGGQQVLWVVVAMGDCHDVVLVGGCRG